MVKSEVSFAEILEDLNFSPVTESHFEGILEAQFMTQVMAELGRTEVFHAPKLVRGYKLKKPARKPHLLTEIQKSAYDILRVYSPHLTEYFNWAELKSCYRYALMRAHPDHGGTSESFQDVRNSYATLKSLVKT